MTGFASAVRHAVRRPQGDESRAQVARSFSPSESFPRALSPGPATAKMGRPTQRLHRRRQWEYQMNGGSDLVSWSVSGRVDPALEGDGERVQGWLPPCDPSCSAFAGRVWRSGDQVDVLECGLVVGEAAAGSDGPAVAGVQALDRVGGADDASDLDVVVEERHELRPGVAPQPADRRVGLAPFLLELLEPGQRLGLRNGGIDRPQVVGDLVPVLPRREPERVCAADG